MEKLQCNSDQGRFVSGGGRVGQKGAWHREDMYYCYRRKGIQIVCQIHFSQTKTFFIFFCNLDIFEALVYILISSFFERENEFMRCATCKEKPSDKLVSVKKIMQEILNVNQTYENVNRRNIETKAFNLAKKE